jgi:hypothetical protein
MKNTCARLGYCTLDVSFIRGGGMLRIRLTSKIKFKNEIYDLALWSAVHETHQYKSLIYPIRPNILIIYPTLRPFSRMEDRLVIAELSSKLTKEQFINYFRKRNIILVSQYYVTRGNGSKVPIEEAYDLSRQTIETYLSETPPQAKEFLSFMKIYPWMMGHFEYMHTIDPIVIAGNVNFIAQYSTSRITPFSVDLHSPNGVIIKEDNQYYIIQTNYKIRKLQTKPDCFTPSYYFPSPISSLSEKEIRTVIEDTLEGYEGVLVTRSRSDVHALQIMRIVQKYPEIAYQIYYSRQL